MENKIVIAPEGAFRSRLLPGVMVCCILAVVCGIPPVAALINSDYRRYLTEKLILGGIASDSALLTWSVLGGVVSLLCVICPGILAVGLMDAMRGRPARGFGFLSEAGAWGLRLINGTGAVLAAAYVIRAVLYVVISLQSPQGVMLIYSMVMMEGLMGVLAWFLFRCVRNFAEGFSDAAASMAYTLSSGRIDNQSIPGEAERGFLALGMICPLWAVCQVVTVTIVVNHIQSYYSLVFATHPMEWLTAASLVFNGAASILMCLYLRRYNRICEWEKYQSRKQK